MKQIEKFIPRNEDISKLGSIKEILNKNVVSKSGHPMGKVKDVLFNDKGVKGIIGKKKLIKYYVDSSFFSSSEKNIMLSIDPVLLLLGKEVFDADGKKLGKVKGVIRDNDTNSFKTLIVKRKLYSRKQKIPKADIKVSKKNIILNKKYG
ncbi:MAG: PRC-barrel domain-containing protein [Candidatus Woesearchaeota archaeon]